MLRMRDLSATAPFSGHTLAANTSMPDGRLLGGAGFWERAPPGNGEAYLRVGFAFGPTGAEPTRHTPRKNR
jgi:hypothetical protein